MSLLIMIIYEVTVISMIFDKKLFIFEINKIIKWSNENF